MSSNPYGRFYWLLSKLPVHGDEMKEQFVSQYTDGRTSSLREMRQDEYNRMCDALEESLSSRDILRSKRSAALRLMQRLGIDTTDWSRINAFCLDNRIAGKVFGRLSVEELTALSTKLRSIQRNGGLKPVETKPAPQKAVTRQIIYIPTSPNMLS